MWLSKWFLKRKIHKVHWWRHDGCWKRKRERVPASNLEEGQEKCHWSLQRVYSGIFFCTLSLSLQWCLKMGEIDFDSSVTVCPSPFPPTGWLWIRSQPRPIALILSHNVEIGQLLESRPSTPAIHTHAVHWIINRQLASNNYLTRVSISLRTESVQ